MSIVINPASFPPQGIDSLVAPLPSPEGVDAQTGQLGHSSNGIMNRAFETHSLSILPGLGFVKQLSMTKD